MVVGDRGTGTAKLGGPCPFSGRPHSACPGWQRKSTAWGHSCPIGGIFNGAWDIQERCPVDNKHSSLTLTRETWPGRRIWGLPQGASAVRRKGGGAEPTHGAAAEGSGGRAQTGTEGPQAARQPAEEAERREAGIQTFSSAQAKQRQTLKNIYPMYNNAHHKASRNRCSKMLLTLGLHLLEF